MTATASSYQTDPQVQQHRWLILTAIGLLTFMSNPMAVLLILPYQSLIAVCIFR